MPSARFDPAIPAREQPQTHALDRAATRIEFIVSKYRQNLMYCKCSGHAVSNKWHQRNKQVNAQNNHVSGEYSTRQNRKFDIVFLWVISLHHAVR